LSVRDEAYPNGDITIEVTGLRSGEKLYEELFIGNDPQTTAHSRILRAHEEMLPWGELQDQLATLEMAVHANDVRAMRYLMEQLVSGYTPSDTIMDWAFLQQESEMQEAAGTIR
jgi:FlaA1/EpsC-like NDP-sugar epimerase